MKHDFTRVLTQTISQNLYSSNVILFGIKILLNLLLSPVSGHTVCQCHEHVRVQRVKFWFGYVCYLEQTAEHDISLECPEHYNIM